MFPLEVACLDKSAAELLSDNELGVFTFLGGTADSSNLVNGDFLLPTNLVSTG